MPTATPLRRPSRMTSAQQTHYAAAAEFARRRYPGALGELIHRELVAYAEFGHRFATDALIHRLVRQVLAPPGPSPDHDTGPRPASASATGTTTTLPPGFALWPTPATRNDDRAP